MSFEWQTEEEHSWEDTVAADRREVSAGRRRLPWLLGLLALVSVAGFFGWRMAQERIEETTSLIEADVRSSHQLVQEAAQRRDEELFITLLSGRDNAWTEAQTERLGQGLLFGETARPFGLQPVDGAAEAGDVTLNAELTEAVLTVPQRYAVQGTDGVTQTVTLTQTAVYRKGDQRWLLSPPMADFWGDWQRTSGQILDVTFRERDEPIARRLAKDIDELLTDVCLLHIDCGSSTKVSLRLESDVSSVLAMADAEERLATRDEVTLPTPTLIGLPRDEQGYEALYRGYARHVVTGLLNETAGATCCEHALFQQALINLQLAEMGLQPAPLSMANYLHLIDRPLDSSHLLSLWNEEVPVAWTEAVPLEVYAFLDFVQRYSRNSISWSQLQLRVQGNLVFRDLFKTLLGYNSSVQLEWDWHEFVHEQVQRSQAEMALPDGIRLPEQDVLALCGYLTLDVYRYDLQEGQWHEELAVGIRSGVMTSLPNDDGFMLGESRYGEDEGTQAWLKRAGEELILLDENPSIEPLRRTDPSGQRMLVSIRDMEARRGIFALLDPDQCDQNTCSHEPLPGMPVWSPDGASFLYMNFENSEIYLQHPGQTFTRIGNGYQYFWLDNETYGYLPYSSSPGPFVETIVVGSLNDEEQQELINTKTLLQALPEEDRPESLRIVWIRQDPVEPNQILIAAGEDAFPPSRSFFFRVTRANEAESWLEAEPRVALLESFDDITNYGIDFHSTVSYVTNSPVNRWQILRVMSEQGTGLAILDLQEKRTVLLSFAVPEMLSGEQVVDWSADGQWLLHPLDGGLGLVMPHYMQGGKPLRYIISHDFKRCIAAVWVNPES